MFDIPNKRAYGMGWKLDQTKSVTVAVFDNVQTPNIPSNSTTASNITWFNFSDGSAAQLTDPAHLLYPFRNLLSEPVNGDSGSAVGGYYNGQTFLVSMLTSGLAGELYSELRTAELNSIIANLDAAQGINTGYQVQVLNVP